MPNMELKDFIQKKALFITDLTGFGTHLHVNDILPDLNEIADKAGFEFAASEIRRLATNLEDMYGSIGGSKAVFDSMRDRAEKLEKNGTRLTTKESSPPNQTGA